MSRHRLTRVMLLAPLLAGAVGGCQKTPRVVVIGIDGASPQVAERLMDEGLLPRLQSLRDAGVYGPLRSFPPYISPRVWTTIATGKIPLVHGIGNWVKFGEDGTATLFYSYDRNGAALWNIVSAAGMKVGVVNWLVTYPPETVNGILVTDHTFPGEIRGKEYIGRQFAKGAGKELEPVDSAATGTSAVYPEEWAARALDPRHLVSRLTTFENPFGGDAPLPSNIDRAKLGGFFDRDRQLVSIALEVEEAIKPDLLMVLLQGIDRVSHFMWACLEEPSTYPEHFQPSEEERENCKDALLTYYRFTDELIGHLLARYRTSDLVLVVSDHGFEVGYEGFGLTGNHKSEAAADGVIFARGRHVPAGAPAVDVTINDVTPTILAWLGLPLAQDMQGKPAAFLDAEPVEPVVTYNDLPIERVGRKASGGEDQLLEQLKSLGYVE